MKTRTALLSLALLVAGTAAGFAQSPQMGTWKMNEAKSQIPAGTVKNSTVVYSGEGDKVKVTTDGTDGSGKPSHTEWVGKFDGKDYPVASDPAIDSRSYKMVDDHTLAMSNKKGGKVVSTGRVVVSADGKTRTLNLNGTDADGKKVSSMAMYDKQ
jgi:hypothetical protein